MKESLLEYYKKNKSKFPLPPKPRALTLFDFTRAGLLKNGPSYRKVIGHVHREIVVGKRIAFVS